LIIEGGVHIRLPLRSPWEWKDIHLLLEEPHWLSGTLIRLSNSNKGGVHENVGSWDIGSGNGRA
jgi:hypothetical protein